MKIPTEENPIEMNSMYMRDCWNKNENKKCETHLSAIFSHHQC